jgi:hypothetical protein
MATRQKKERCRKYRPTGKTAEVNPPRQSHEPGLGDSISKRPNGRKAFLDGKYPCIILREAKAAIEEAVFSA